MPSSRQCAVKGQAMFCPECGKKLDVYRTKAVCKVNVLRERRCAGCGFRVLTWERITKKLSKR